MPSPAASAALLGLVSLTAPASARFSHRRFNATASKAGPRSVIMMIPDGTGPATYTVARECKKLEGASALNLDDILVGAVHTYATDSRVTDSASSATAYSAGIKTYNGAIGVDDDVLPVGSVMEAAKVQKGMLVGSLVTSRVTHATPAAYSAHVFSRNEEDEIARQYVREQDLDFMIGGGRRHFTAAGRSDNVDLEAELRGNGVPVFNDAAGFDSWVNSPNPFPAFGLLDDSHMMYEVEKRGGRSDQPTLVDMTAALLKHLEDYTADGPGFMVMIEGSRIDHAGHANDIGTHAREAMVFDDAVGLVKDFVSQHPNVLMVSVADHETGGMSLGKDGVYEWFCEDILGWTTSMEQFSRDALEMAPSETPAAFAAGFAYTLDSSDAAALVAVVEQGSRSGIEAWLVQFFADLTYTGWSTGGHSGVDSNLYAMGGEGAFVEDNLMGAMENNDVAKIIELYLDLDLQRMTDELRSNMTEEQRQAAADVVANPAKKVYHHEGHE